MHLEKISLISTEGDGCMISSRALGGSRFKSTSSAALIKVYHDCSQSFQVNTGTVP